MSQEFVVALVRHGEYHQPANVPSALLPYGLTQKGGDQARDCADTVLEFARSYNMTICPEINCSRMLRAWQTASIIARNLTTQLGQDYVVSEYDCLSERSVGAVANLTVHQIETLLEQDPRYGKAPEGWKSSSDYQLPFQDAESLTNAGRRVAKHISSLSSPSKEDRELKLIVGHGASIRHAAVHLGVLAASNVRSISMFHARPVFIGRKSESDLQLWSLITGDWKNRTDDSEDDGNAP